MLCKRLYDHVLRKEEVTMTTNVQKIVEQVRRVGGRSGAFVILYSVNFHQIQILLQYLHAQIIDGNLNAEHAENAEIIHAEKE